MNLTLQFWELARQNKFIIVLSQLTLDEVLRCSEPKRSILFDYLKQIDFDDFDITKDVEDLGNKYIQEEIIPKNMPMMHTILQQLLFMSAMLLLLGTSNIL